MDTPKLLRVGEVAKVFNVSRPTIYRLVKSGQLEAFSIGGSVRIPADAVQAYLMTNRVGSPAPAALPVATAEDKPRRRPKPKQAYAPSATPEMLAERKAWQIARKMAVKLVPADATDAQWDAAIETAYHEARKRLSPPPAKT